jgi:hypothetical protein
MWRLFYLWLASIFLIALVTTSASADVDCDKLANEPDYKPEQLTAPMRFFRPERYACLGNALNNPYLAQMQRRLPLQSLLRIILLTQQSSSLLQGATLLLL